LDENLPEVKLNETFGFDENLTEVKLKETCLKNRNQKKLISVLDSPTFFRFLMLYKRNEGSCYGNMGGEGRD
jgi:hypothetical protein